MRAYLLCKTCKEMLHLGKISCDDEDRPVGFTSGSMMQEQLGLAALQFLAQHLNSYYSPPEHDVQVVNEFYVDDMNDQEEYQDADDRLDILHKPPD